MATDADREHWSDLGSGYRSGWQSPARQAMSRRELAFVTSHAARTPLRTVLDIGVGNGRILEGILGMAPPECQVHGVDLSEEMVAVTRRRLSAEPRLASLHVCDISRDPLPVPGTFDVITAIRVLKYSENWATVIERLSRRLTPGGVFIFSLSNRHSLNRLSRPYAVRTHHTTVKQLVPFCAATGLDILELSGSTRLPYSLYTRSPGDVAARALSSAEQALDSLLGKSMLARELFVAVTPKP